MNKAVFIGDFAWLLKKKQCAVQFQRLYTECERELSQEIPAEHPAMSITFMGLYILNLALMYRLSGERKYLEGAKAWMHAVCNYPYWGNDNKADVDLSASWVLFGLSVGYDWLYDVLHEDEKQEYFTAIQRHASILYQYKKQNEGHGWSTEYWQNHNWINMTGLAAAGYVINRHGGEGAKYIEDTEANFDIVFSRLAEDGSNYEGVSYWRYGGMWLFVYAYLRRNETGRDFFSESEYLKHTFYYRLYQSSPDMETQLNFGDTHDRHSSHPACVYYLVAHEYKCGHAQKLGNMVVSKFLQREAAQSKVHPGILPEAGLEYIWYDPEIEEEAFTSLPTSRFFPDLGLISLRSGWNDTASVFSFKCGYPGGETQWKAGWQLNRDRNWSSMSLSHHHPDNLAYILVTGQKYFSCEDGYNRAILPIHHNTLLVDGRLTDVENVSDVYISSCRKRIEENPSFQPDHSYFGIIRDYREKDGTISFLGDSTRTYPEDLQMKEVSRQVFTENLQFFIFINVFDSNEEHSYTVVCNTDEKAVLMENGGFQFRETGKEYYVFGSEDLETQQDEHTVTSIMTPQEPDKTTKVVIQNLCTSNKVKTKHLIIVECITPTDSKIEMLLRDQMLSIELNGKQYSFDLDSKKTTIDF